jgi:hypothetical protein
MAFFYLNFCKTTPDTPWIVSQTNEDRTQMISQKYAADLEINVPCKTFVGKFHYFQCEGLIAWDGLKATINPIKKQKMKK